MFDEVMHLLTDPAHWAFEAISGLVYAVPVTAWAKWRVRKHDRKVHKIDS